MEHEIQVRFKREMERIGFKLKKLPCKVTQQNYRDNKKPEAPSARIVEGFGFGKLRAEVFEETVAKETDPEELISGFTKAVLRIAAQLGKHPRDVSKPDLINHRTETDPSSREIDTLGITALRDAAFPLESNPFDAIKMTSYEASTFIASLIEECANTKKQTITETTWDEFRHFIKLRYGSNDRGIARYVITKAGGFNSIRDAYFPPRTTEVGKERLRTHQHALMNRKLGTLENERQFVLDRLAEFSEEIFQRSFAGTTTARPKKTNYAHTQSCFERFAFRLRYLERRNGIA